MKAFSSWPPCCAATALSRASVTATVSPAYHETATACHETAKRILHQYLLMAVPIANRGCESCFPYLWMMKVLVRESQVAVVCISTALLPAYTARSQGRMADVTQQLTIILFLGTAGRGLLHGIPRTTQAEPIHRHTTHAGFACLATSLTHALKQGRPPDYPVLHTMAQPSLTEAQLCKCKAPDIVHIVNTPQQALVVPGGAQLQHSAACMHKPVMSAATFANYCQ